MNLFAKLMQGLAGTGAHRAADRIPVLEADLAAAQALAKARQEQLAHADALITRVCQEKSATRFKLARLTAQLDVATKAHQLLEQENDELTARLTALRAENANLLAVYSPAPADHGPAIPLRDAERTAELKVSALWGAHGLRDQQPAA